MCSSQVGAFVMSEIHVIFENIIGEIDAIKLYDNAIEQSSDAHVIEVLKSIRDEERVHIGELIYLALEIDPEMASKFIDGCEEAQELISDVNDSLKKELDSEEEEKYIGSEPGLNVDYHS